MEEWGGGPGLLRCFDSASAQRGARRSCRHMSAPCVNPAIKTAPLDTTPRCTGFYKDAPWFVKMGVLLLRERGRGRASPVWGYVEQLPSSIDTPVRWAPAELEELQYEAAVKEVCVFYLLCTLKYYPVATWDVQCCRAASALDLHAHWHPRPAPRATPQIQQQQGAWRQQYDQFCAAARAAQGGGGGNKYSYEDFLWGLENVRSRAFSGPYTGSSGALGVGRAGAWHAAWGAVAE